MDIYGNNRIISEDGFTRYDYSDGSASSWNKEPFPMLVINAVDGTIIDLSNGYRIAQESRSHRTFPQSEFALLVAGRS